MIKRVVLSLMLVLGFAFPAFAGSDIVASQAVTTDIVVGVSGQPTLLYGVSLTALAGTDIDIVFRNGTGTGDARKWQVEGTASDTKDRVYSRGIMFPNGLFADIGGSVSIADVLFKQP